MTKFEQLLDYIVNEEHDKANELFHEIVVEKSREIYENLIAEEESDEEIDESADEEEMEESAESEEEMEESEMDLEDSYMMDGDDDMGGDDDMPEPSGLEKTDDLESDVDVDSSDEEDLKMSIQNAMAELQAAFDAAENLSDAEDEFDDEDSEDDLPKEEDEMMGFMEGRRMTREYVEKVGNDWDKSSTQKQQAKYAGAGTGETEGSPDEGHSPVSSGSGKPNTGANARNIAQGHAESAPDGTTPHGKAGGFLTNPKEDNAGNGNVPGGNMGVKNLKKVSQNSKTSGPVGSGTGDKAGQTSLGNQNSLLKHIK